MDRWVSAYELGCWATGPSGWTATLEDLRHALVQGVRDLAPRAGEPGPPPDLGPFGYMPDLGPARLDDFTGRWVRGSAMHVLWRHDGEVFLGSATIYPDGLVTVGAVPGPRSLSMEDLRQAMADDVLLDRAATGSTVHLLGLGWAQVSSERYRTPQREILLELLTRYEKLNGRRGASKRSWDAYKEYERAPTPELLEEIRETYARMTDSDRRNMRTPGGRDQSVRDLLFPAGARSERWQELRRRWRRFLAGV